MWMISVYVCYNSCELWHQPAQCSRPIYSPTLRPGVSDLPLATLNPLDPKTVTELPVPEGPRPRQTPSGAEAALA